MHMYFSNESESEGILPDKSLGIKKTVKTVKNNTRLVLLGPTTY